MNLPVALLLLGMGGLLIRAGITNAPGGAFGELGRVLRGEPATTPTISGSFTPLAAALTTTPTVHSA